MSEPIHEARTIKEAVEAGAAKSVSGFVGAWKKLKGRFPNWQSIQTFLGVKFPNLVRRQLQSLREYTMSAVTSARGAQGAGPKGRAFLATAPQIETRQNRRRIQVSVPIIATNVRDGTKSNVGHVPVEIIVGPNATKAEILVEIERRMGPPVQYTYRDPYGRVLEGFREPAYGEPIFRVIERIR